MLIPLLKKAISAQGATPPQLTFVTVGQVPILRNHTMAAVAPLRRIRRMPIKTGRK